MAALMPEGQAQSGASFSTQLEQKAAKLVELSKNHPFVLGLADGSLSADRFRLYVLNDSFYLSNFARVQALGAAAAIELADMDAMARHARATYEAEMGLHAQFFTMLGVTAEERASFTPSPSAVAYVNHLLATAHGAGKGPAGLATIVAAILPCYVVYLRVGKTFARAAPSNPVYAAWLATYAGDWFETLVKEQCERIDRLVQGVGQGDREGIEAAFLRSCQYEVMFWEAAWSGEKFPGQ